MDNSELTNNSKVFFERRRLVGDYCFNTTNIN